MIHNLSPRWLLAGVLLNRDARRESPHLWRGGFLVLLFCTFWSASAGFSRSAAPGLMLLQSLGWTSAFGLIALAVLGVGNLFRDEWVGNNWDLLQITGVSGFDLLLAKLVPTWLTALSLLLLEIPCLLLCVTLGGVTPLQVAAVVWQLMWLFLVMAGFTVLAAAGLQRTWAIVPAALAMFYGYEIATLVIDEIVAGGLRVRAASISTPRAMLPSEFQRILTSGFAGPVLAWPTLLHAAAVGGCLWLAAQSIRRQMAAPREEKSLEEIAPEGQAHQTNIPVWRPGYKVPRIEGNAIEWKDYHFTLGGDEMMTGKWGLVILGLVVLGLALLSAALGERPASGLSWLIGFLMFLGLLGTLAYSAQRLWVQEIREQTLAGLLLLPCGPKDILWAKLRAFLRVSVPEIVVACVFLVPIVYFSAESREWIPCQLYVGLLLSIPMVVCTDAAWRFLPQTWAGFGPRTKLAGMNLLAWGASLWLAVVGSPLAGLLLLALLVPIMCRSALHIAAEWLGRNAGAE
jgi:hypothetical protein